MVPVTSLLLLLACSSNAPEVSDQSPVRPPAAAEPAEPEAPQDAPAEPGEVPATTAADEPDGPPADPEPQPAAEPAAEPDPTPAPADHSEHQEQKEAADEPAAEEPATEAPAADEPAAGEPPAEQPAAEEPQPTGPVAYTLEAGRSQLVVLVRKDTSTAGSGLSHDHVIMARGWRGTATWDPDDVSACDVRFTLPVSQLDVDSTRLRKLYGLEGELSDKQRADVKENMLAKDQLDAGRFPDISFRSTRCTGAADQPTVQGTLTIHGTGKAIAVPMTVAVEGDTFTAKGGFSARHSDFGMEPFSALFGQLKNQEALSFKLKVQGKAQP